MKLGNKHRIIRVYIIEKQRVNIHQSAVAGS